MSSPITFYADIEARFSAQHDHRDLVVEFNDELFGKINEAMEFLEASGNSGVGIPCTMWARGFSDDDPWGAQFVDPEGQEWRDGRPLVTTIKPPGEPDSSLAKEGFFGSCLMVNSNGTISAQAAHERSDGIIYVCAAIELEFLQEARTATYEEGIWKYWATEKEHAAENAGQQLDENVGGHSEFPETELLVIDPCYLPDTSNGVLVKTTGWNSNVLNRGEHGADFLCDLPSEVAEVNGFPVESGQFVMIPAKAIPHWTEGDHDDLSCDYGRACNMTTGESTAGWMTVGGYPVYVSRTAIGDGTYGVHTTGETLFVNTAWNEYPEFQAGKEEGADAQSPMNPDTGAIKTDAPELSKEDIHAWAQSWKTKVSDLIQASEQLIRCTKNRAKPESWASEFEEIQEINQAQAKLRSSIDTIEGSPVETISNGVAEARVMLNRLKAYAENLAAEKGPTGILLKRLELDSITAHQPSKVLEFSSAFRNVAREWDLILAQR